MNPLTVVHVSTQRTWRGGEEQIRLLARGLRERGHRNLIFAVAGGALAKRLADEDFEVVELPGRVRGLRAIRTMRRQFRGRTPDVVHYHDSHALSAGGVAAWGLPIQARVTARRVDFAVRSTFRYRLFSDRVIAVSRAVGQVCEECGIASDTIRVVYDGVDPARARSGDGARGREALALCDGQPLLLTVASLTDHKGHTYLLEAFQEVVARHPNVRLALAGDGELRESLEQQARQAGIEGSVTFLGFRDDVPDLLKAADLFVMPSHLEGLCSTLVDVMFAHTPIVATTAGGIPELVGPTSDNDPAVARLVPPRDPSTLARAINDALDDAASLQALASRAEQRAGERFTADHMVEGTLDIYRELLAR